MPYALEQDHRDLYAGVAAPAARVGLVYRQAARIVARAAPAPDPVGTDYPLAARDAELFVGRYLWRTEGFKTSVSKGVETLRTSESYASLPAVQAIVQSAMGDYYVGTGANTAYVSTFRS